MNIPNIGLRRRRAFGATGWGVAAVLAIALSAGGAYAANTGGGNSLPAGPAAATANLAGKGGTHIAGVLARFGRRVEHADAVVRTRTGPESILVQRGTITALDAGRMTVRSLDGWTGSWTLNDATHYRANGSRAAMSDLKVGDRVLVAGAGQDTSGVAQVVRDPGPAKTGKQAGTAG
jgi:hypothetical protein